MSGFSGRQGCKVTEWSYGGRIRDRQDKYGGFMRGAGLFTLILAFLSACGGGNSSAGGGAASPQPVVQYTVTVDVMPESSGMAYGGGVYREGEYANFPASANGGYQFSHWEDGGVTVSTSNNYVVEIKQDMSLVAHFVSTSPLPDPEEEIKLPPIGKTVRLVSGDLYWLAITESETFGDNGDAMWRTDDEGESWTVVAEVSPSMVVISQADEEYVVALIGDAMLFSDDGGETWEGNVSIQTSSTLTAAAFSSDGESLYVAVTGTSNPGLHRLDKATGWSAPIHVFSSSDVGSPSHAWLNGVATSRTSEAELYITSWYAPDIWKSDDGGDSFVSVKSGIAASSGPFAQGVCVIQAGGSEKLMLWGHYSENGGLSWVQDGGVDLVMTVGCPQHRGF